MDGGVVLSHTQHKNNNKKSILYAHNLTIILYIFKNVLNELYIDHTQACIYNMYFFSRFFVLIRNYTYVRIYILNNILNILVNNLIKCNTNILWKFVKEIIDI